MWGVSMLWEIDRQIMRAVMAHPVLPKATGLPAWSDGFFMR
jgi:hypothetical protein